MPRRHTDLLSEAMEGQTRPVRWLLRVTVPVLKLARVIIALQAIGGVVGIVLGVPTLNGPRVAVGFGQLLLAAIVFGVSFSSEQVSEVNGPDGAFVMRTGKRRLWRDAHGLKKVIALVVGHYAWAVVVRRRQNDPFGHVVFMHLLDTQPQALAVSRQIEAQIRHGEAPAVEQTPHQV